MRLEVFALNTDERTCRVVITPHDREDLSNRIEINAGTVASATRVTLVNFGDFIKVDGVPYRIGHKYGGQGEAQFIDEDGHMASGVTSCRAIPDVGKGAGFRVATTPVEFYRNMKFDENTAGSQIIGFLDDPVCDHPGCLNVYGSDDLLDEIKGTRFEGKVSEYVDYTVKEAMQEPRIAVKMALFGLAVAGVRGTGARQAFRRLRCAYIHALPFDASRKHEVTPNTPNGWQGVPGVSQVVPVQDDPSE